MICFGFCSKYLCTTEITGVEGRERGEEGRRPIGE
jgi:hypothetical protein